MALSLRPSLPVPVASDVRRGVEETAGVLRSLGHEVTRRDPAYNEIGTMVTPRYLKGIQDDAERMPRPQRLQRRTRGFARLGRAIPRAVFARALRDERRQAARINRVLEDNDVLLTPVSTRPPVAAAEWEGMSAMRTLVGMAIVYPYPVVWNVTQPTASVPAGFTTDGLPLGAQLVGRPNDEGLLLSLAAQLEAERRWAERRPPIACAVSA